ncbi:hypothetical protein [Marinobacterium jannaschii]|uniref:hypothetical protein n=1 Tax=Marinobacterium jannaschii TaxID=64970 RepID=UPI000A9125F3|nr:hypothetical protein [Marinobacterium jannaschii]
MQAQRKVDTEQHQNQVEIQAAAMMKAIDTDSNVPAMSAANQPEARVEEVVYDFVGIAG